MRCPPKHTLAHMHADCTLAEVTNAYTCKRAHMYAYMHTQIGLRLYTGPAFAALNRSLREQRYKLGKIDCGMCPNTGKGKYYKVLGYPVRGGVQIAGMVVVTDLQCSVVVKGMLKVVTFKYKEEAATMRSPEEVSSEKEFKKVTISVEGRHKGETGVEVGNAFAVPLSCFDFQQTFSCSNCLPGKDCFTTVIAVINSSILKLGQQTPLAEGRKLFRGVKNMAMPEDTLCIEKDARGFVELSFASATPDRHVAEDYAGVLECRGRNKPVSKCRQANDEVKGFEGWPEDMLVCNEHRSTVWEISTGEKWYARAHARTAQLHVYVYRAFLEY
jgi:hypothetical protein